MTNNSYDNTSPGQPDGMTIKMDMNAPVTAVRYEMGFYTVDHGSWSQLVDKATWLLALAQLEFEEGRLSCGETVVDVDHAAWTAKIRQQQQNGD